MSQNINDLKAGQVVVVVKNKDGSFSPLSISPNQAINLNKLFGSLYKHNPFVVNREVKLIIKK